MSIFLLAIQPLNVAGFTTHERIQNDILYHDDECGPVNSSPGVAGSSGVGCGELGYRDGERDSQANKDQIWSFLKNKGLSDEAAAGIMGNMSKESAFMPDAQNGTGEGEGPPGGVGPTTEFNPGSSTGRGCIGLVQWCYSRAQGLVNKANAEGRDWRCLDMQLDYMWYEMTETSESQVMEPLKGASSPAEAANIFHDIYERSNTATGEHLGRDTRAEDAYTEFTGKTPSADPTRSSSSANSSGGNDCPAGRSGASSAVSDMNGFNYAFPVQLSQSEVSNGYSWPCPRICHHDSSPAFDLSNLAQDDSSEHIPVVAITDGEIQRINNSYGGTDGCQSFQLVGSDGYQYWYGHIQSSSVDNGATVSAGQVISEIGRRACTGNNSYPHLHIDRGPKGSPGGTLGNRDPGFVDVINELWRRLGGGSREDSSINL